MSTMEKFGSVHMPVSCKATSAAPFERAIALMHSFWYEESFKQFQTIATNDPTCAMAQWGMAMTEWRPLWDGIDDTRRNAGITYIDKATALKPPTDRERQYIAALSGFLHSDPKKVEAATATYTAAMGKLHADYPNDQEATAFYGLALVVNGGVVDPVGDMRKALAVLQPAFKAQPNHPGYAHYIVHACDMPQLAQEGLPAARVYARIAPSSPHALHMPGHIFARLGMWPEDISSDEASVKASNEAEAKGQGGVAHQMHAHEFLFYAYLQSGQDAKAQKEVADLAPVIAHLKTLPDIDADGMMAAAPFFEIEFPGISDLERHDWKSALALPMPAVPDTGLGASVQAYTDWIHAIAAGHLHDAAAASNASDHADALLAAARAKGVPAYMEVQLQTTSGSIHAWKSFAAGKNEDALKQIAEAADTQDRFGQAEVDIPLREMYADMLLELNRPTEALAQYKTSLANSPNRFNGLYNAGRAAEQTHQTQLAATYYKQLLVITDNGAHTQRPEIAHAQAYLKNTANAL